MSLARQHFQRCMASLSAAALAQASGAPAAADVGPGADQYELMVLHLRTDIARLRGLQSIEKRIELKRDLLSTYDGWVQGRLDAAAETGTGVQDDVLVTIMLWRIDVGDFEGALPLADYALRYKLTMPEGYSRGVACLFAEQVAEGALKILAAGEPAPAVLERVVELTEGHDMPDEVRAKLQKALGYESARLAGDVAACEATGVPGAARIFKEQALDQLKRAVALHDSCGAKTEIKRLEKELNKEPTPPAGEAPKTASQAPA